jgi:hypothetical protein
VPEPVAPPRPLPLSIQPQISCLPPSKRCCSRNPLLMARLAQCQPYRPWLLPSL